MAIVTHHPLQLLYLLVVPGEHGVQRILRGGLVLDRRVTAERAGDRDHRREQGPLCRPREPEARTAHVLAVRLVAYHERIGSAGLDDQVLLTAPTADFVGVAEIARHCVTPSSTCSLLGNRLNSTTFFPMAVPISQQIGTVSSTPQYVRGTSQVDCT